MWFFDDNICRALDRIWVWKTLFFIGCEARGWFLLHVVVTLATPLLALKPTSDPRSSAPASPSAAAAVILDLNFPRQRSGEGSRGDFIEAVQKTHIFCFGPGIVTNAKAPLQHPPPFLQRKVLAPVHLLANDLKLLSASRFSVKPTLPFLYPFFHKYFALIKSGEWRLLRKKMCTVSVNTWLLSDVFLLHSVRSVL